jgi:hypothetical protein
MEYRCQAISILQMNIGPKGFIMPICESCKTKDCTNPIEKKKVSICGVTKIVKVINRSGDYKYVIFCEGYLK